MGGMRNPFGPSARIVLGPILSRGPVLLPAGAGGGCGMMVCGAPAGGGGACTAKIGKNSHAIPLPSPNPKIRSFSLHLGPTGCHMSGKANGCGPPNP